MGAMKEVIRIRAYAQPRLSITICRTCPRPASPMIALHRTTPSPSDRLAADLAELIGGQSEISIRRVECLSFCQRPIAVMLRGQGGERLLINEAPSDGATSVLRLAQAMLTGDDDQDCIILEH